MRWSRREANLVCLCLCLCVFDKKNKSDSRCSTGLAHTQSTVKSVPVAFEVSLLTGPTITKVGTHTAPKPTTNHFCCHRQKNTKHHTLHCFHARFFACFFFFPSVFGLEPFSRQETVFKCLQSWVRYVDVPAAELVKNPLLLAAFDSLGKHELFETAVDLLVEVRFSTRFCSGIHMLLGKQALSCFCFREEGRGLPSVRFIPLKIVSVGFMVESLLENKTEK